MGELNQSQGRKTTKLKKLRLYSIQNLSALENVLRTGAMAMLCTTETQIEEIWKKEKPEAQAEAKGNIEKQHPKSISAELATAKIGHDSRHPFIFPHFYRPSNIGFKSSPLKALCLKGHGNPKFATTRSFRAQFRLVLVYGRTVHDSRTAPALERAPAGIWPGCQIAADRYVLWHDNGGRSTVQCGSCVTMLGSPSPS